MLLISVFHMPCVSGEQAWVIYVNHGHLIPLTRDVLRVSIWPDSGQWNLKLRLQRPSWKIQKEFHTPTGYYYNQMKCFCTNTPNVIKTRYNTWNCNIHNTTQNWSQNLGKLPGNIEIQSQIHDLLCTESATMSGFLLIWGHNFPCYESQFSLGFYIIFCEWILIKPLEKKYILEKPKGHSIHSLH